MIVRDLFTSLDRNVVLTWLVEHYPREQVAVDLGHYARFWDSILALEPVESDFKCCITLVRHTHGLEEGELPTRWDVSGLDQEGTLWAIEFTPWQAWLSMEVIVRDGELPLHGMLAIIMDEMTVCGFEQSFIAESYENIMTIMDSVEDSFLDEINAETVDDLKRLLERD